MSPFKEKVIEIIKSIPYGTVMSYGQVAVYAGAPRAAREVGWILNSLEEVSGIPWWRVTNDKGYLSIRGTKYNDKNTMKVLLEKEGLHINEDYTFDIVTYRYLPTIEELKAWKLSDEYLEMINQKYLRIPEDNDGQLGLL